MTIQLFNVHYSSLFLTPSLNLCLIKLTPSERRSLESLLPLDGCKNRNSLGFLRILLEAPIRYFSIKLTFPDINLELNPNVYERGLTYVSLKSYSSAMCLVTAWRVMFSSKYRRRIRGFSVSQTSRDVTTFRAILTELAARNCDSLL